MRVLIASDGSASARAALAAALRFPWPPGSRARGVVALGKVGWTGASEFRAEMVRALHAHAEELRTALKAHWPRAEVVELHQGPADGILAEAARFRADAIVLGWRGHGSFARLLAGSVSRAVAERAKCSVLVVRADAAIASPLAHRFAVGFDGSRNSRKALRFLARLAPPPRNRLLLLEVVEPLLEPPLSRATRELRSRVRAMLAVATARRVRKARRRVSAAAERLRARGWRVGVAVSIGEPLSDLLESAGASAAEALVVGARGATRRHLLLGSVSAAALDRSALPLLIAR